MKHILTILLFTFLTTATFAKGGAGTYYIKGTAYGTDKVVLKNVELTVKIGNETKSIKTDNNGQFKIEVHWESACPSDATIEQQEQANKKNNPEFIYINYADKKIKLYNKWKKYAQLFPKSKDEVTWKKDLHFS